MRRKKNNALLPLILFVAVLVLSIGGLVLAQNIRDAQIARPGQYRTQDDIPRVTADEAYQAVTNGEGVILDVRAEAQFEAIRAEGSINIPLAELEARLDELNPDTWYLTI